MVDFTNCEINNYKYYGGKNGGKICVVYNNEDYMLKFPNINEGISEYIVCNIFKTLGLNTQDTMLGTYNTNGNEKVVVACKDFTSNNNVLKQFAELKNSQIETSKNGYGTELSEVIETIENQLIYDVNKLKDFFWQMFIADSLVGNFDRHNENWGFLINESLKKIEIAPIYDCASCLYPQLTDEMIAEIINNEEEMKARVYVFPTSSLKVNNKKINYYEYISSLQNEDCNKALVKLFPKIDLVKINSIINDTPFISNIRKEFYKKILKLRYDEILKVNYNKLVQKK